MRILILSDIHANWPALAAIHQAEELFDECFVLGDLVEFGVFPREVIAWVKEHATVVIRGNHDHALAQRIQPHASHNRLKKLRQTTREYHWKVLLEGELRWLGRLPVRRYVQSRDKRFFLIHATPRDPLYEYLSLDSPWWQELLEPIEAEFVLVGHTHVPGIAKVHDKTILNPGSVGQPRDSIATASYALFDGERIHLKRVEYDIQAVLDRMQNIGFDDSQVAITRQILESGSTVFEESTQLMSEE